MRWDALNILFECLKKKKFKVVVFCSLYRKMIDWSCVIIVKHLWKILFSERSALWVKLDTDEKRYIYVCGYPTIPAEKYQP